MSETRKASDVERTVTDVLDDLSAKRIDGAVAERIRDAADRRVGQVNREGALHRSIAPR